MIYFKKNAEGRVKSPVHGPAEHKTNVYDTTSHALLKENLRIWKDYFINVRTSVESTLIGHGEQTVKVE